MADLKFLYHPTLDIARSITEIHPYLEYLAAVDGFFSQLHAERSFRRFFRSIAHPAAKYQQNTCWRPSCVPA